MSLFLELYIWVVTCWLGCGVQFYLFILFVSGLSHKPQKHSLLLELNGMIRSAFGKGTVTGGDWTAQMSENEVWKNSFN